MSEGEERIYAIGLRETGKPGGKVDDGERGTACRCRALPREQEGEHRRIELFERRAIHFGRTRCNPRQTRVERASCALVRERRGGFKATHDVLPLASCWLRCVRNCSSPSTPCCWICSLN